MWSRIEYKVAFAKLVRAACTNLEVSVSGAGRSVREEVAELLGVHPDEVDPPDADLIASGLDSIRMMSLSGRWRKQGLDINFAALAEKAHGGSVVGAGGGSTRTCPPPIPHNPVP